MKATDLMLMIIKCFLILAPFLIFAALLFVSYYKRWTKLENEYEMLYAKILNSIDNWDSYSAASNSSIWDDLVALEKLKYKNEEKTEVLISRYLRKRDFLKSKVERKQ